MLITAIYIYIYIYIYLCVYLSNNLFATPVCVGLLWLGREER